MFDVIRRFWTPGYMLWKVKKQKQKKEQQYNDWQDTLHFVSGCLEYFNVIIYFSMELMSDIRQWFSLNAPPRSSLHFYLILMWHENKLWWTISTFPYTPCRGSFHRFVNIVFSYLRPKWQTNSMPKSKYCLYFVLSTPTEQNWQKSASIRNTSGNYTCIWQAPWVYFYKYTLCIA